jgi:chemosensory pili system protein ChpA (sensor histidine kinase/response regulator)
MDVVRSEVNAMGGRIETATARAGHQLQAGAALTTAVTQVVMLRCGEPPWRCPRPDRDWCARHRPKSSAGLPAGSYATATRGCPSSGWVPCWVAAAAARGRAHAAGGDRAQAQQRVALHVDEVLGNQEVVVKNLGPQLSRLPGWRA